MLLSNYGRDQVGESFEGSQAPLLHQQPLADVSSPSSSLADRSLKPSDQMLACQQRPGQERRLKPHSDQVLKCPRCESMNTKFCYYNNYSLTQPRHFCKNCKRYWTKGGALRNVPVGGGCRKNKRVKQRQHDHPPAATSDEAPAGGGGSAAMGNDGASSSGILQQEFPVTSGSSGLYEVHKGSNGVSLPFDRVDQVPRIYSGGNPPISINWAGHMTGVSLGNAQQTYDASILGLNLPGAIKQEPVHPADLTSIFDPSLSMAGHAPAPLNEGLSSYVPIDNFGLSGATGEVLWRFPQPKLVSLLEEGNEQESRHPLLDLEASGGAEKLKPKGKTSGESIQVSSEFDQQADSSSAEWQPTSDGFFESGGDTGYWGNGGWSSDLHQYGGTPATGNQLL